MPLPEPAISGTDQAVPAEQRDYVTRIGAAGTATGKIAIYAHAITAIQQRMAPVVFLALRDAAATDPDCATLWREIARRRAINVRAFAAHLRRTGELREDLTDGQVADIIWSMNAAEYWDLLVRERAGSPASSATGSSTPGRVSCFACPERIRPRGARGSSLLSGGSAALAGAPGRLLSTMRWRAGRPARWRGGRGRRGGWPLCRR